MVKSRYISDILDLLCDGDELGQSMRPQLPYLLEGTYEYTGSGFFLTFEHLDGILQYRRPDDALVSGVRINSASAGIEAEAQFFTKKGLIDYLEVWCYAGDYPKSELTSYVLTQAWNGSPGKTIERI